MIVFQTAEDYESPVWPRETGKQQQMAHIDFFVDDLDESVKQAINCGAKKADIQYYDTSTVRVCGESVLLVNRSAVKTDCKLWRFASSGLSKSLIRI